ncbi:MFS transporter [Brevibacillus fortis]|uniref:MFS transporter n=1 Tax=Brevibacillus fortis TaxID=2126352 RepID=A0A2P7V1W7_9BACL|nr:MFS transporter [Brevibacillus fortis]PSJ93181.1 MFS transporter [Brevibacillus fortis]
MKGLWGNKVFLTVFISDTFENIGIWIRNMALLYYVMETSGNNPTAVSLLTAIELAPILVFSIIGGALADRWNPKRTMIAGNLLSALSVLVIVYLLWQGMWIAIFFATFISAVVSQFSQPSSAKMMKRHIPDEHVAAAVSISQSTGSIFLLVGPIVGTFFFEQWGIYPSLLTMACLFFVSALILLTLPTSTASATEEDGTLLSEIKAGFAYVKKRPALRGLAVTFACLGLSSGLINSLEVFVVTDRLLLSKESIQWFNALDGLGMLLGGILASIYLDRLNGRWVITGGLIFFALSVAVEVLSVWVYVTAAMRFFTGIGMAFLQIVIGMFMIKLVDEAYIGRVNGTISPLMVGLMMVGSFVAGPLMQMTSLITVFLIASVILLLTAWGCTRIKWDSAEVTQDGANHLLEQKQAQTLS